MSESPSPVLWSTVSALPDYLLMAQTRQLARHEQALQILVLDHLREIEARGLHLTRGYGSLFDYVVRELGYTAAAAWRRIKAMRLCSATNGARELLQDGKLNLSNAAQLQNLFERSDRGHGRGRPPGGQGSGGGPGGEARHDGAAGEPASAAAMRVGGGDPAPGAAPVLDAAAREELVKRAAGKSTREVQQMVAEVDPELARPNDRMRALGGGRWELKATIDAECRHGLEKLQMLLSHTDPHLTLGGLLARLVRDGLDRYDPARPPRTRRSRGRNRADSERSASAPARRGTEAKRGGAALAAVPYSGGLNTAAAKRQSDADHGRAGPAGARGGGAPPASAPKRHTETGRGGAAPATVPYSGGLNTPAPKRHTEAEHGSPTAAPVREIVRRTASAPKHPSAGQHGGAAPAAAPTSGGHTASLAKRQSEVEPDPAAVAGARDRGGRAASPAKRHTEVERVGAAPVAVPDSCGLTTSPAKRPSEAERGHALRAVVRGGGDSTGAGGVLDRADCADGPRIEAGGRNASWMAVRDGRLLPTSAAKRIAYAAGLGAVGAVELSPALERHLAALSCFGAGPGSRSRYIPAAVRREVWRRDLGCCSYVDPHSGRRCGSRYRLEIDHIVPFALGGGAEPGNLRLRCEAHHRLRHAQRPAYRASVCAGARRALESAVDPREPGRTVESHTATGPAGA